MISANEARSFWVRLFDVSDILRNTSYYLLEKNKVRFNFAEFPIVLFFFERPDARPAMKDLLTVTGLSSGALSQAVDALIEDSLLERVRSEQDHRSFLIQVTDQLRAFRKTPLCHFEKMLEAFRQYSGLTPEENDRFRGSLCSAGGKPDRRGTCRDQAAVRSICPRTGVA